MSSRFSGGGNEFYPAGGIAGRSIMSMNNPQAPYRSPLDGILPDPASQIIQRRPDVLVRKRSLLEFQQQQQLLHLHQQLKQQQQQGLGVFLRNVKPRTYQHTLSAASNLSDASSISSSSLFGTSIPMSTRYGLPILQQLRPQNMPLGNGNDNNLCIPSISPSFSGVSLPNSIPSRGINEETVGQESEKKMMNRLQELEKQLLGDIDEESGGDALSGVTNSEWSAIQNLVGPTQKPISLSPTSSSSSCCSSSASPPTVCQRQSIIEAATAISDGKSDVAEEILAHLNQVSNDRGTSQQRLTAYMTSALRACMKPAEYPPPVTELYGKEHMDSTQMLYDKSPCFKLGFMAANLAILEAISDQQLRKLHVVDFDIGQGGQYVHLLHALGAKKTEKPVVLKITTFADFTNGGEDRLRNVGDVLKALANKIGVCLCFSILNVKIHDLSVEALGVESGEYLAVNLAFRLYKLPDESVTTENFRDELLRRVKGLSPKVVTVVEQELNGNTAPFVSRVKESCGYYAALFDSVDATVPLDNPERVRIEQGLGRKMINSVACEGRDRVERCEVFGKWRARMSMAGFHARPISQLVSDSLRSKLNSLARGNPGFTVIEQSGGVCFGWMGRTLTVASAWC